MGAELIRLAMAFAFSGLATLAHAQMFQTTPVEQRLGSVIAALTVENARLAAELETARQTIEKLKEELARKNQSETK
jgi:hypothetical protein